MLSVANGVAVTCTALLSVHTCPGGQCQGCRWAIAVEVYFFLGIAALTRTVRSQRQTFAFLVVIHAGLG